MIKCNVCGHDNPLGRVHCVQCGTKIDLSKIVPEGMAGGKDSVVIKKSKGGGGGGSGLKSIIKIVDLAILVVLIIGVVMMLQEPEVKNIPTDPALALTTKTKLDGLSAAQQNNTVQSGEFTEVEINSLMNEKSSPLHIEYPEDTPGAFSTRITKYTLEFGQKDTTAVATSVLRLKDWKKKIIVRATAELVGEPGDRRVKVTQAYIGKLPLHILPAGEKLANWAASRFFRFQGFDAEMNLLRTAREVELAPNKVTVTTGQK